NQLQDESATTRKMLERVPTEKLDWQPHPKSMSLVRLATHVAEIPNWIPMVTEMDELDFSKGNYAPQPISSNKDLLDYFEKNRIDGKAALEKVSDDILEQPWSMRNGEEIFFTLPKGEVLRMTLSQIIHHRAQLGVYLRLLDIPIPGTYGPSADEA
ncbi:MAG: DinB family protein, partial [Bacteroidota bacterium]|nr:DinB family protein [Bacteroidota bacterium]